MHDSLAPLVSAIMPTRNRPRFVHGAITCFLSQTWTNKELVILDDREAPSFATVPEHPQIRYDCTARRYSLGAKRNLCCSRAQGEFVCFWDDDDWSAPGRIADQAGRLLASKRDVTGYCPLEFRDEQTGQRWQYQGLGLDTAPGTTLMFRKSYWRAHPFNDKASGEDSDFVNEARGLQAIVAVPANGMMFARNHPGNTCPRALGGSSYRLLEAVTA